MGQVINFSEFKKNRKEPLPKPTSEIEEITELIENSEVVTCPTCSAPAYKMEGEEEFEYIFAPEEVDVFLETLTERQELQVQEINERSDEIDTQLLMLEAASRDVDVKADGLLLAVENEDLAGVLSRLVDEPTNEEVRQMARELLDGRDKE